MFEPDYCVVERFPVPADWPYSRIPPRFSSVKVAQSTEELSADDMRWISALRPKPTMSQLPDEVIERLGSWCVDPVDLLTLSSTCRLFAELLRTADCWLDHHRRLGYDIGVLRKKARHAAAAPKQPYGSDGWGLLVKSAIGKAEFPDSDVWSQVRKRKVLPHTFLTYEDAEMYYEDWVPRPTEEEIMNSPHSQARGRYYLQVMFDILSEHESNNLVMYALMYAEVLCIRLHDTPENEYYRWLQALTSASFVFIRTFHFRFQVYTLNSCQVDTEHLVHAMKPTPSAYSKTCKRSITYTCLCACKILYIDAVDQLHHTRTSQLERRLYPPPHVGQDIWEDPTGEIRPGAWSARVKKIWQGRVYVMGLHARHSYKAPTTTLPFPQAKLAPSFLRIQLDFLTNGDITGHGFDFSGDFAITGYYKGTYVEMIKRYTDDEGGTYIAAGHMLPWGIYGHWHEDPSNGEDADRFGYWGIWIYEGADAIPLEFPVYRNGRYFIQKRTPYRKNPGWFDAWLVRKAAGILIDRRHGVSDRDEDVPPWPAETPLPEPDIYGL